MHVTVTQMRHCPYHILSPCNNAKNGNVFMRIILYNCVSVKEVETYIRMLIHCFFFLILTCYCHWINVCCHFCACSTEIADHLAAICRSGMRELKVNEVMLEIEDELLTSVFKYAYSGEVTLNENNAIQIYKVAHYLQMDSLVDVCSYFIGQR